MLSLAMVTGKACSQFIQFTGGLVKTAGDFFMHFHAGCENANNRRILGRVVLITILVISITKILIWIFCFVAFEGIRLTSDTCKLQVGFPSPHLKCLQLRACIGASHVPSVLSAV